MIDINGSNSEEEILELENRNPMLRKIKELEQLNKMLGMQVVDLDLRFLTGGM